MKVGFIGTGNMGGALAHAAAQSPAPAELLLSNRTPEKAQALAQQLGATVSDNETIAQTCDYIFLGVKPQMMADLLARLRPILSRRQEGFVLVSMAAGLTLHRLREMVGLSCPILRIMPNTACAVGAGLTLYVPSPEVTELLLHRLGLVWTPEPEGLAPCWKALLSGSPNFDSLYEQLVQPRREILASSPLAADALLLDAFYADEMRPLPVEWEPFLSTRQLALQRGLQGRWEEAVRLEPLPLLAAHYGEFLYAEGEYTAAIEVLRDAYRSASDAGYPYLMLSCRAWMGNCYSDLGRMEEMLTHYSVAERLAEALRDTGSLSALRYNVASTQLELGQPEKALPYFASLPRPGFLDLHKLAICHEQLGHREQALTAVQQAEPMASGEMEQRMLALVRYRLEHPDYLHDDTYGTQLLDCFQRLRDTYPMGFTRFHLPWVLAWYKANRQYRQACRLLEEFPVK
jgi:tetratricopeptide (TPR) repeat protein